MGETRRLATKLVEAGYGIRRTDRHFELASVGQELVEKFSKRTQLIEDFAKKNHVMLTAKARALMKETGMDFGHAFEVVRARDRLSDQRSCQRAIAVC